MEKYIYNCYNDLYKLSLNIITKNTTKPTTTTVNKLKFQDENYLKIIVKCLKVNKLLNNIIK